VRGPAAQESHAPGTPAPAQLLSVACDVTLHTLPSPWNAAADSPPTSGSQLSVAAHEALRSARTDVQSLREERAALVAQVTQSESRCVCCSGGSSSATAKCEGVEYSPTPVSLLSPPTAVR